MNLPQIKEKEFSLETIATKGSNKLTVKMKGEINLQDPFPVLEPFFIAVHKSACADNFVMVNVDLKQLKFISSSGIKVIINWIKMMCEENAYKIHFICDLGNTWQKLSVSVLKSLAVDKISYE